MTATDPDGEVEPIRVDIRITDVNEASLFILTADPDGTDDAANREISIVENTPAPITIGMYAAEDPDSTEAVTWDTGGDDGDLFEISTTGVLTLPVSPDYEDPTDDNMDNLYELTVVSSDGTSTTSLDVTVKVTNDPTDDDDNMPATAFDIFNRQPEVNTLLKVEGDPEDPDDGVTSVRYQWYWQTIAGTTAADPATCPAFVPHDPDTFDPQNLSGTDGDPDLNPYRDVGEGSQWRKIDGATNSSYVPTLDRVDDYETSNPQPDDRETAVDAFDCLMVRASYLDDGPRLADESTTPKYDESRRYAYAVSDFSVQPDEGTENVAPEFQDGDTALAGTQIRLRVLENFPYDGANAATGIFNAVALATAAAQYSTAGVFITEENMAPDLPILGTIRILDGTFPSDDDDGIIEAIDGTYAPDDFAEANHKLTFAIGGTDAEHFTVDKATGAITFTDEPDYEVLAEKRYTVTLTAHDPTDYTDSITIILDVENIDEDPMFVEPTATANFNENSTDPVATYTANDPEGVDDYSWGLTGTDAALFDLSVISGRLTFRSAPNFEDPEDLGTGDSELDDNVYDVVVHLLLDGETVTDESIPATATPEARTQAVAITVKDVAENPVFTKTTDDNDNIVRTPLNIAENKQPNVDLNRPVENSPQASDEDEILEDDMYASVALVYTITGTGTEAISIVPATGELRTTRVLDYESGDRRFEVKVTATDPTGLDDSIDLVINVTDEDEAPVGGGTNQAPQFQSSTMTRSVDENMDAGMDIGVRVTATDNDGNILTYTLGGSDAGHFTIDMMTGQLKTMGALDYESKSSYTVTVTATDDDPTKPLRRRDHRYHRSHQRGGGRSDSPVASLPGG